ncbi:MULTISPECIES: GNAT family N-acetyltransferase [Myroides]|uniref:GNAT family N-acetyltransferase n=1 Tax=Myroides albus TaxID=2562892 RepID=A0A6I3LQZ0_9FLAO|nr:MULTISPECIES: GNAT family protein [Myroides]MTG98592.1 GNAT family N-acetyltransferase [Myroides albus]MVX36624.1 GNAT family N-acetyltransferase [Myroides sp. LoEW2-1]UVD79962.1 GNAT family N-acetyltransferase [Myroides albus]
MTPSIILSDDRVLLRPLEQHDVDNLLVFSENEPEIWDYSPTTGAGRENLEKYIGQALKDREHKLSLPFIVYDKNIDEYIGSTRLYNINPVQKTLLIGYSWYGKKYRGTGVNKHCKYVLLKYAFEVLEMERVEFRADFSNQRSIAAMKSIGCTLEGVLRSDTLMRDGRRRDTAVLSILKSEWFETVREKLEHKL